MRVDVDGARLRSLLLQRAVAAEMRASVVEARTPEPRAQGALVFTSSVDALSALNERMVVVMNQADARRLRRWARMVPDGTVTVEHRELMEEGLDDEFFGPVPPAEHGDVPTGARPTNEDTS